MPTVAGVVLKVSAVVAFLVAAEGVELEPQERLELPVRLAQGVTQRYKALHKATALEVVAHKVAGMMRQGILLNTAAEVAAQETKTVQATQGEVLCTVEEAVRVAQGLVLIALVVLAELGVLIAQVVVGPLAVLAVVLAGLAHLVSLVLEMVAEVEARVAQA